jgi:NAD(P)-dependent dehydrogenase (short-subunit alcohol dehydrogenase family)
MTTRKGTRPDESCPPRIAEDPESVEEFRGTIPMRRLGRAEEIAPMNLWLCTDEASYATGSYFVVDGGQISV